MDGLRGRDHYEMFDYGDGLGRSEQGRRLTELASHMLRGYALEAQSKSPSGTSDAQFGEQMPDDWKREFREAKRCYINPLRKLGHWESVFELSSDFLFVDGLLLAFTNHPTSYENRLEKVLKETAKIRGIEVDTFFISCLKWLEDERHVLHLLKLGKKIDIDQLEDYLRERPHISWIHYLDSESVMAHGQSEVEALDYGQAAEKAIEHAQSNDQNSVSTSTTLFSIAKLCAKLADDRDEENGVHIEKSTNGNSLRPSAIIADVHLTFLRQQNIILSEFRAEHYLLSEDHLFAEFDQETQDIRLHLLQHLDDDINVRLPKRFIVAAWIIAAKGIEIVRVSRDADAETKRVDEDKRRKILKNLNVALSLIATFEIMSGANYGSDEPSPMHDLLVSVWSAALLVDRSIWVELASSPHNAFDARQTQDILESTIFFRLMRQATTDLIKGSGLRAQLIPCSESDSQSDITLWLLFQALICSGILSHKARCPSWNEWVTMSTHDRVNCLALESSDLSSKTVQYVTNAMQLAREGLE